MTTISAATEPAVNSLGVTVQGWMGRAACTGYDPQWWYPEEGDEEGKGKALRVCNECPVRDLCLMWSFVVDDRWGTLGGKTQFQRTAIRNRLKRVGKWEKFISYCLARLMPEDRN